MNTIKVIFYSSWATPQKYLTNTINILTPGNNGKWNQIEGTSDQPEADYIIVLDEETKDSLPLDNTKKIYLQREPPCIKSRRSNLDEYFYQGTYDNLYHVCVPWVLKSYHLLKNMEYKTRTKKLVAICSGKAMSPGHRKRLAFLKYLANNGCDIDIYGRGLRVSDYNGKYKGELKGKCKFDCLSQYTYAIVCENGTYKNYMTEKIYDCFLSLTIPFYWGCSNIFDYYPENSLHQIDLDDFGRSLKKINNIINSQSAASPKVLIDLFKAQDLTLCKYNIWPTIETIIRRDKGNIPLPKFHGQFGQDRHCYETFFKNKPTGTFIELGASDGIKFSNTLFFEQIGWTGLCIEPRPEAYEQLIKNRTCMCDNSAIDDKQTSDPREFMSITGWGEGLSGLLDRYDPKHIERIERESQHPKHVKKEIIKIHTRKLSELIEERFITSEIIDFLSLDTEGNELNILKSINWDVTQINVITVENNYNDPTLRQFLGSKGFKFNKRIQCDEVYVHDNYNII